MFTIDAMPSLPRIRRRERADGEAAEQPTQALAPVPADAAGPVRSGDEAERAPRLHERSRMRRRMRELRRLRELALRDLGGLVLDLDRFGRDRQDLVRSKLDALRALDDELRALERALDEEAPVRELREAGISACACCGTLHGSDARFCPGCGARAGAAPDPPADQTAPDAAMAVQAEQPST